MTIEGAGSPMQLADRVAEVSPAMVILSHLPPEALAQARYQVRRLRSRFAGLAIVVGRWGEAGSDAASAGALRGRGHARGLHAGRCPRPDPGQGRFRGSCDVATAPATAMAMAMAATGRSADGDPERSLPGSRSRNSIGASPARGPADRGAGLDRPIHFGRARRTRATAQNQNNSTMTPPSAPSDLL